MPVAGALPPAGDAVQGTDGVARLTGRERDRYVAGMFARIAGRYDLMNSVMTARAHHRWRRAAVRLAGDVSGTALDVATGTGDFALEAARLPGVRRVVGVDVVPGMLDLAGEKARRRGQERRTGWTRADAHALPFVSGSFDLVTSGFGLRNVSDLGLVLGEMARVTATGGTVVLLEITPLRPGTPFARLFGVYFRRVTPWLGGLIAGDREAYTYLPRSVEGFPDAAALAGMLGEAGLRDVRYRRLGLGTVAVHRGTR